jgi:hypothetical protein
MIHSIDFFGLSNNKSMSIALSAAFEVGQVAALCGILILDKANRFVIWSLFILLTAMQIMSNVYYCYEHLGDYSNWSELFGLNEEEPMFQKRMLSIASGAILPVVALGFIKSLVDYLKPSQLTEEVSENKDDTESIVNLDEDNVEIEPGEKFNSNLDISDELEEPVENIKEVVIDPSVMPRTPAQYLRKGDPITGGGSIRRR